MEWIDDENLFSPSQPNKKLSFLTSGEVSGLCRSFQLYGLLLQFSVAKKLLDWFQSRWLSRQDVLKLKQRSQIFSSLILLSVKFLMGFSGCGPCPRSWNHLSLSSPITFDSLDICNMFGNKTIFPKRLKQYLWTLLSQNLKSALSHFDYFQNHTAMVVTEAWFQRCHFLNTCHPKSELSHHIYHWKEQKEMEKWGHNRMEVSHKSGRVKIL